MVTIVLTKFTAIQNQRSNVPEHIGVRMYDEEGNATYDNTLYDGIDTGEITDLEILEDVVTQPVNDAMEEMLDAVRIEAHSIIINYQVYGWNEIKHIMDGDKHDEEDEDEDEEQRRDEKRGLHPQHEDPSN